MRFDKNRHAVYKLNYHLVVVTKYRRKCINREIMDNLEKIAYRLFAQWKCKVIEFKGESDHVHILFSCPPQVALSKLVNNYKTVSSRLIRKQFGNYLKNFYWKPYFWSQSYCIVSTGSAPLEIIKKYIENQNRPS